MGKTGVKLEISKTEFIEEGKSHYLYQCVPISVEIKVNKFLASGEKPALPDEAKRQLLDDLLADGDVLIYPDKKNIERVKEIYNALTDTIAIFAFVPCGIEIFGHRYEVVDGTE